MQSVFINIAYPGVRLNEKKAYRHKKPCLSCCTLKRKESPPPQKTLLVPVYTQTQTKPTTATKTLLVSMYTQTRTNSTATINPACPDVHSNENKLHRHKKPCLSRCTLKLAGITIIQTLLVPDVRSN